MAKQHSAAKISQKMWALDFLQSRTSHYSISFESLVSSLAGHLNSHHTSQAHMRLPMFTHLQQVSIRFKTNPADQANCLSRKLWTYILRLILVFVFSNFHILQNDFKWWSMFPQQGFAVNHVVHIRRSVSSFTSMDAPKHRIGRRGVMTLSPSALLQSNLQRGKTDMWLYTHLKGLSTSKNETTQRTFPSQKQSSCQETCNAIQSWKYPNKSWA